MNTQENNIPKIPTLAEVLDQYQAGTLDMGEVARKCYLTEKDKHYNKITWIHNDELKNQVILRGISKNGGRDLLRNMTNPLQK